MKTNFIYSIWAAVGRSLLLLGFSLVVLSGAALLRPMDLSWWWPLCVVERRPSCSEARGIFLNQESNQCLLLWQMDSYPLHHRSAPVKIFDGWGFL